MNDYLCVLRPSRQTFPGDATEQELATVAAHFRHLQQELAEGRLALAGRTQDEPPMGIMVFRAENDALARRFVDEDPAVRAGVFKAELRPYVVALLAGRDGPGWGDDGHQGT